MILNTETAPMQNTTIYLKDYQAPDFLISKVQLDFQLEQDYTLLTSVMSVQRNKEHGRALVLNGEALELVYIELDGRVLSAQEYHLENDLMTIASVPDEFVVTIQTKLKPDENTALSGLYQSSGNFCTQCEAEGFRRMTYFLDRPDVLSEYTVRITADKNKYPVLLSNGNLQDSGGLNDDKHWALWHDPHPKPSYLFALVAGNLAFISDQFTTMSGRKVALNIYTQAHNINQCQYAMDSLVNSMRWDEQVYGREYDLDIYNIVAVDDFNMGAMENKGLNIFNSKFVLADPQTATDTDYQRVESVIGHEYFHNWSGNRVTCRDWFQLSLKEGFTVFRDQEFSADMASRAVKRVQDVQILRNYQFKEDAGPMAHPVRPESYQEINNFYTATIYEKGAEVIRMMHRLVGAQGFRKGTDLYFQRFDGQAVTTEDFVQCIEQANGIDLGQFRLWYSQAGTPVVSVEQSFNQGCLSLTIQQSCPPTPDKTEKKPMQIPLSVALFDDKGSKLLERTLNLTKAKQTFDFDGLSCAPVVSFLRDFSAPIKVEFAQSNEELALLAKLDDDGFVRWECMQRLALNLLLPALKTGQLEAQAYQQFKAVFECLLTEPQQDKAILAQMLKLPNQAYIAQQLTQINPDAVVRTRALLKQRLANDLYPQFLAIYQANCDTEFCLNSDAMARRALKNQALSYLHVSNNSDALSLVWRHYNQANNITDRLAAFECLVHDENNSERAVSDFYQHWKQYTLVLDKWFAIQAMSPHKQTLERVKSLIKHTDFSIKNPNKVRSLLGAFAGNMSAFHQPKAYEFVADCLLELDSINPQVAANLMACFNDWRRYSEPFSSQMKQQVQRIVDTDNLSVDVREIASKALSLS